MLDVYRERAPLKRNISAAEVGDSALFLASDLAKGISGEILYVDAGYHITGI
jgi:enoyl-[acyl-carrier protein] reductase I